MRVRRWFLLGGAVLAPLGLFACGGSGDDTPATATRPPGASATAGSVDATPLVHGIPACLAPGTQVKGSAFATNPNPLGGAETVTVVAASSDLAVGENNLAVGIQDKRSGQPIGNAKMRFTLYDLRSGQTPVCQVEAAVSAPGVGEATQHVHTDGSIHTHGGEAEDRSVHYAHVTFDHAGNWGLAVEAILPDGTAAFGTLLLQVAAESAIPAPGDPAIKSDNLTKKDVANIKEIDSGDPPNDMHDLKIRDVLAAGRPLVIVFATPAYCSSAFCGPVTQEVEELRDVYKDRVDFIHIEIYRDYSNGVLNPTAREWLLRPDGGLSEPVVYVVGKDGVIFDRWDGPAARNVMEGAIQAVANGEVYEG